MALAGAARAAYRHRSAFWPPAITGAAFIHHFGSMTQKAMNAPRAPRPYEIENRAYFRKKWGLNWWRRRCDRLFANARSKKWQREERTRFGHTLFEKWIDGKLTFH